MTPCQARDPFDWPGLLSLIHRAFAGMQGRIDPPSSLHRLTPQVLAEQSRAGEVWVIGTPPVACMFLTPQADHLYVGKLAVDPDAQAKGYGRRLLTHAEARAHMLGLPALQVQARVELAENHRFFQHLGFTRIDATAHPGYTRPTSLTFRKPV